MGKARLDYLPASMAGNGSSTEATSRDITIQEEGIMPKKFKKALVKLPCKCGVLFERRVCMNVRRTAPCWHCDDCMGAMLHERLVQRREKQKLYKAQHRKEKKIEEAKPNIRFGYIVDEITVAVLSSRLMFEDDPYPCRYRV